MSFTSSSTVSKQNNQLVFCIVHLSQSNIPFDLPSATKQYLKSPAARTELQDPLIASSLIYWALLRYHEGRPSSPRHVNSPPIYLVHPHLYDHSPRLPPFARLITRCIFLVYDMRVLSHCLSLPLSSPSHLLSQSYAKTSRHQGFL